MQRLHNVPFSRLALFNFIMLSLWGVVLRYMQLADLPFNYQYLLHAHSHFAFSGWMFLSITRSSRGDVEDPTVLGMHDADPVPTSRPECSEFHLGHPLALIENI